MKPRVLICFILIIFEFSIYSLALALSIFTVTGTVTNIDGGLVADGLEVMVNNQTRVLTISTTIGKYEAGKYSVVFMSTDNKVVAAEGDIIKVTIKDKGKLFGSQSYKLTSGDISKAKAIVPVKMSQYTITATAGAHGNISPSGEVRVSQGEDQLFKIIPDIGYHIEDVGVDGVSLGAVTEYTFKNVSADHSIYATFAINYYTITATAGSHGSITPSGLIGVAHGSDQTFIFTPNPGYHVSDVLIDGASNGAVSKYTFANITTNHTISVTFDINRYSIIAKSGEHGNITPSGEVVVTYGAEQIFTITPDDGYHIADVVVDGISKGVISTYTFTSVTSNHTISANFEINSHSIISSSGEHGSIIPSGIVYVIHGTSQDFSIIPDKGYHIFDVAVDGVSKGAISTYKFVNVKSNHSISGTFEINSYPIIVYTEPYGTVSPSGIVQVPHGSDQTFTIAPNIGYHIAEVMVDGVSKGAISQYTFTNVTKSHMLSVTFEINHYIITATAEANGSITPSGDVRVNHGKNQLFVIKANPGYSISGVIVDGVSTNLVSTYTFVNVTSNHSIHAKFSSGCVKGDINGDGDIRSNDAILALRISVGLIIPTPDQKCSADMNDDGQVRADDAILILRKSVGLTAPVKDAISSANRRITISLIEAYGVAGDTIAIPIKTDRINELSGGEIQVTYTAEVLHLVDVVPDSNILLASNTSKSGEIRIAFAKTDNLSSKTLAEIRFNVLTDSISELTIQDLELYGSDGLSMASRKIGGKFTSWAIPSIHNGLLQNFPNPFNPDTWIPYQLKEASNVIIGIYSISGELIRELSLGDKSAGSYVSKDRAAYWDGKNENGEYVSSGIYFCTFKAGDFSATRKMILKK